jgi:hypothetical protein
LNYVALAYKASIRTVTTMLEFHFDHLIGYAESHGDDFASESAVFLEMWMVSVDYLDARQLRLTLSHRPTSGSLT